DVVYVAPGEHLAEADAPTGVVRKVIRVAPGELVSVTLTPDEPPGTDAPPPRGGESPTASADDDARRLSPAFAIAGGALSLVGAGVTVAAGLDTVAKRDAFLEDRTQSRLDDAFASQTRTNVLLAVTLSAAVVTGIVAVFFTDWSGRHPGASARARRLS